VSISEQDYEAVTVSESANKHIKEYLTQNPGSCGIRLAVKKTGCSGFSYVVDYVQAPKESDIAFLKPDNYWIYIDEKSFPYLKGLHMDYVKQGFNTKFVFTNPNQTGQCGCGESFAVDEG
jgi:iron-sulfur cluster assembly protein